MSPHRDVRLDAARGLAMLLVLYGHGLEPLFLDGSAITQGPAFAVWQVIYAFHMPFFFLLCGVTDGLKAETGIAGAVRSAVKLTATALAFSTLAVVPQIAWGGRLAGETLLDNLRGAGFGLAPLWFLVVLALVRVIHAVAMAAASTLRSALVLAGALALSWFCAAQAIKLWHVYSLLGALPFYAAGRRLGPRVFGGSTLAAGCGLAALLVFAPANLAVVSTGQYGVLPFFALTSVGGCAFMAAVAGRLSGRTLHAAASIGRMSFDLFIVSGIALALAPRMGALDGWLGAAAAGILTVPLQIGAGQVLRRPITAIRKASEHMVDALDRRSVARAPA